MLHYVIPVLVLLLVFLIGWILIKLIIR
ncbi:hypothetical protein Newbould305_1851 [Staphylococcus aureus subsp. aureus str. Newbould 305]|nr:hypothetical protein Newbould305_1851 [Staphylococcus aureus subsp. aureus str. Newbould 305]KST21919.1 hypothetical protein N922_00020 [Staphylococcus aureus MRSA_CVMN25720PS]